MADIESKLQVTAIGANTVTLDLGATGTKDTYARPAHDPTRRLISAVLTFAGTPDSTGVGRYFDCSRFEVTVSKHT